MRPLLMDRLRLLLIVRAWVFACVSVGMPLKELTNSQQYLQIKKKKGHDKTCKDYVTKNKYTDNRRHNRLFESWSCKFVICCL